ncbi:endoribonuclease YbeY [Litchfieldella qijiaojingensis]|uniref:Endoribonuclease YbeY n=1 Tax=Litchfieldella qijiaojingensis TaxID=980347 RepID=A0ABQ2YV66_9GAMM|nr:rRNA maturation RNase YbeY [Halomonas qijiaojingensis]GGX96267.1 endoribonuclease YbeY [Halomonas qijiaojingensis]
MNEPPPVIIDRQVAISTPVDSDSLPSQAELESWVGAVLSCHSGEERNELTVRFVDAVESRALNRDYRGKDRPTNVLSFPFDAPAGIELPLLGDLVICHEVVVREAREQDKSLIAHYAHMVVHGTLHLLGYDHMEETEAERMERLEGEILARFDIADPYLTHDPLDSEDKRHNA